jgi:predicted esterase
MNKLYNALVKSAEIAGYQDSSQFFNDPKNFQPPPPPPPKKTPEEVFQEAQVMQIQADVAMKQAELDLKRQSMLMDDDRKRDEMEADLKLKARELEEKFKTEIDEKAIQDSMNTPRTPV